MNRKTWSATATIPGFVAVAGHVNDHVRDRTRSVVPCMQAIF
jgi:hypothetical protein